MKLLHQGRTYLLGSFPVSFEDLKTRFANKIKPKQTDVFEFFFRDSDSDKIVVADDEDLQKIKEIFIENVGGFIKIEAELIEQPTLTSFKEQDFQDKNACVNKEKAAGKVARSYHEFLSTRLPQVTSDFRKALNNGVPCEDCLGVGVLENSIKCKNCYGKGFRPLSGKWKLIINLIECKFTELVAEPLRDLFDIEQSHEEGQNIQNSEANMIRDQATENRISSRDYFPK